MKKLENKNKTPQILSDEEAHNLFNKIGSVAYLDKLINKEIVVPSRDNDWANMTGSYDH